MPPVGELTELRRRLGVVEDRQTDADTFVRDQLTAIRILLADIDKRLSVSIAEQRALAKATSRQSRVGLGAVVGAVVALVQHYFGR